MQFILTAMALILVSSFSSAEDKPLQERIEEKRQELGITEKAETNAAEAKIKFDEFAAATQKSRATKWSLHYYDTRIAFDHVKTRYITRTSSSDWINKIDKHDDMPNLGEHTSYLGRIEMTSGPQEVLVKFYPANPNLPAYELINNRIIEIPSLGMSFWRYGEEKEPNVRVHNYERPFADLFTPAQFYDYNSDFRVEVLYSLYPEPIAVDVVNSNGGVFEDELRYGFVEFMMNGKYHKLFVYNNKQIRFTDDAAGAYPGGRYVYPKDGDLKKQVFFLDFNLSHDPPCAYSQAYTCSLPLPEENIDQPVEAGRIYPLNFVE